MARRAKVILLNGITSYGRMGLGFLIGLAITRIALHELSAAPGRAKEVFGTYAVLAAVVGFTAFLNESIQAALVRFLAIAVHEKEEPRIRRLFSSGWAMNSAVGGGVGLVIAGSAYWLVGLFDIPPGLLGQARGVLWLIAGTTLLTSTLQPWQAALMAEDRFTLTNLAALGQQALTLAAVAGLGWIPEGSGRLLPLAGALLVPPVAVFAALAGWTAMRRPAFRVRLGDIRPSERRQLLDMAGWSSVANFACSLYDRADQVIINILLGPAFNTPYAVTAQFQGYIVRCTYVIPSVLLPAASQVAAAGDVEQKQDVVVRATRYALAVSVPLTLLAITFRREIIQAWLGSGFEQAIAIFPLAMLIILVQSVASGASIYVNAANRLKWPALIAVGDGIINILLSVLYVKGFGLGLMGVLLGTLTTTTLSRGVFFTAYAARLVRMPLGAFYWQSLRASIGAIAWMWPALWLIERSHLHPAWTVSLLCGVGLGYVGWMWFVVFDGYERQLLSSWRGRPPATPAAVGR